jgi:hypothetical protein
MTDHVIHFKGRRAEITTEDCRMDVEKALTPDALTIRIMKYNGGGAEMTVNVNALKSALLMVSKL